ncbi:argininosuccinate lyase [Acetobacter nitrogenifigens DSM 23921 = NBRC 105050]|nr:argininosuccinate lyase [Acetobacter nitrogenifigens]GBQ91984.1 argininosuccinate lyase [Acetobacter nitrogenifigens DSM 23921 = NBRC 105050]
MTSMQSDQAYQGFRASGGRLTEEPLKHIDFHRSNLLGESIHGIHAFDKAHVVMMTETGVITAATGKMLLEGLRQMEEDGMEEARARADGGMHSGEHYLINLYGEDIGGRIHLGRSSGDLIEVARRITFKRHVQALARSLIALRGALLDRAAGAVDVVMPGYTHGQHAQPTTFAHWATMFEICFARDMDRLASFYERVDRSPAGAAILTGSDFPFDRQRTSDLLGFAAPLDHTMDAILSHDLEMEYACTLSVAAQTLGRIADDLFLWSTAEFRMVELPDRYCGTSSIMPQKKNPDALEDMKGLAAQSLGFLVTVFSAEKGPTGFPIMERRNTQAILWECGRGLALRLGAASGLIEDVTLHTERMAALAGANWAQVTDLSSALVRYSGRDWRSAHHLVACFVRDCIDGGLTPATCTTEDLDRSAKALGAPPPGLSKDIFAKAMDPLHFVEQRTLLGGPASVSMEQRVLAARAGLRKDKDRLAGWEAQDRQAAKLLEDAIDRIVTAEG